jgi:uncharacterized protein (TIGR00251 family)
MPLDREFKITDAKGGIAFTVRVVTKAATTELAGIQEDGTLKIRLVASPAGDPAANQELVEFLARELNVSPKKIEIVAGQNGREKLVSVEGLSTDDVEAWLGTQPQE